MTPERFARIQAVFDSALEQPRAERHRWVQAECQDDEALQSEVLRLLQAEADAGERLESEWVNGLADATRSLLSEESGDGDQIGRYRLIREIGRGGMGRVFEAEFDEAGVKQRVAIKLLRRDVLSPSARSRFLRERRLLASLVHPGIARLRDIGETAAGQPYLVMELARGLPITQWCAERRLGITERLRLFRQVLAAVSYAHRQLIVHRDLKPGNVLLDDDGQVKLLDFGIAKALDGTDADTQAHDRMLTPMYASPEQLLGATTGVACDVYSLGAMLYELVTGSVPHPRGELTTAEFERRVTLVPPPPLTKAIQQRPAAFVAAGLGTYAQWKRQCPEDLDPLIQKSLHKSPDERFPSVDHFDDDLRNLLEQRPILSRGGGFGYRAKCFVRRHRVSVAAGALAGVALLGGAVTFVLQAEAAARDRDRAQAAVEILQQAFQSADPFRMGGEVATARGILQGAGERLLARLADDPETYAPIALDLVEIQFSLGLIAEEDSGWIERLLKHPAALRIDGGERAGFLAFRLAMARERRPDARARLEEFARRWPASERLVVMRAQLAILEQNPEGAVELLLPTGRVDSAGLLVSAVEEPDGLWRLADALQSSDRALEAQALLEQVANIQANALGIDHPRTLVTRLRLADVRRATGAYATALRELDGISEGVASTFGPRSSTTGLLQATRARALAGMRSGEAAAEAFLAAERAYGASLGPTHRNTIKAAFNAAQLLAWDSATRARGLSEFDRVVTLTRSALEPTDPLRGFVEIQWASALRLAGRYDDARKVLSAHWEVAPTTAEGSAPWREEVEALLGPEGPCTVPAGISAGALGGRLAGAICEAPQAR